MAGVQSKETVRPEVPDSAADRLARWVLLGGLLAVIAYCFVDAFIKNWFG